MLGGDRSRPLLPPEDLFLSDEAFFLTLKAFPRLQLSRGADGDPLARPVPPVAVERKADDPLLKLKAFTESFPGRILLLAESPGRRETISQYLAEYGVAPVPAADFAAFLASDQRFMLGVGSLSDGFVLGDAGIALLTEN